MSTIIALDVMHCVCFLERTAGDRVKMRGMDINNMSSLCDYILSRGETHRTYIIQPLTLFSNQKYNSRSLYGTPLSPSQHFLLHPLQPDMHEEQRHNRPY